MCGPFVGTFRRSSMILVQNSGALVDVAVAALNRLTHTKAFRRGDAVKKYYTLVPDAEAPLEHPHPASWTLISRIYASGYLCKIKLSPGMELGASVDVESTEVTSEMVEKSQMGDARASAKDTRGAANSEKFKDGYFSNLFCCCSKPKPTIGIGSHVKVVWNPFPNQTWNLVEGKQKAEMVPAFLILAHELLHADRMMRGKSLGDVVGFKSLGAESASVPDTTVSSMVDYEHIEVIGLEGANHVTTDKDVVTENQIRSEHKFNPRTKY
jgi:hypothetical protein